MTPFTNPKTRRGHGKYPNLVVACIYLKEQESKSNQLAPKLKNETTVLSITNVAHLRFKTTFSNVFKSKHTLHYFTSY